MPEPSPILSAVQALPAKYSAVIHLYYYEGYSTAETAEMLGKPAATVVSCRRGGATEAFARLNMYFQMTNMPLVSSQYWNQVHGNTPEEVKQDIEGLQTMRTLGRNMAWLIKCIAAGKAAGIGLPQYEAWTPTNFIH